MQGVNRVTLLGHLGSDPEVKYTPQGVPIATVSLATSESWTGKDGQKQERTEWHRLCFWRKLAETVGQYCHKGSLIYVEGKLQTRSWDDAQGNKKYMTEIVCHDMKMLDKAGSQEAGDLAGEASLGPPSRHQPAGGGGAAFADDDDIPFAPSIH